MSKILLCSHNYWVYDPILLFNFIENKKIFDKNSKILVVTSVKEIEDYNFDLIDINFEFVVTSEENQIGYKIINKLNNGYHLIICYPPKKIKSGILRILQSPNLKINLNDIDIFTIQIYLLNLEKIALPNDFIVNLVLSLKYFTMIKSSKIFMNQWFLDIDELSEEQFTQILKERIYP